jgi:hypothetical protein
MVGESGVIFGKSARITGPYNCVHGAVRYYHCLVLASQQLVDAGQVEQAADSAGESWCLGGEARAAGSAFLA